MKVKLYAIPMSHPTMSAQLMLEHKGIGYERIDLVPGFHRFTTKALGFPGPNVPAIVVDGKRIQGTRTISRALDDMRPEPPLFPSDPGARREVEEAERFGDDVLQELARRMVVCAFRHAGWPTVDLTYGARMNRRLQFWMRRTAPMGRVIAALYGARDAVIRADLFGFPAILDKIDEWIEKGVIDGEELNAADFQLAPSLQLLLMAEDYAQALRGRPLEAFAHRVAPGYPSRIGPTLPAQWLEPLGVGVQAGPAAKLNA
jgi:glutathione S-transferase